MESDVLPCYVACDVSLSMTDHLGALNAGLREFRGGIHADPAVAERVLCCVVGFAETAYEVQPLYPLDDLARLPERGESAGTGFGPAFVFLRKAIAGDVRALEAHRLRVHRPLMFFLSDGCATDPTTWPAAFAALTDPAWASRPRVVAFGVGDADEDTLGRIGTFRTFLARDGVRLGPALIASVMRALPRADRARSVHDLSTSRPRGARTMTRNEKGAGS
ncbi:vWA domain-containing protein [Amycolatopsis coloradensis]|uniref:vWA domain-containing protein n=1 Tax=Amycolatopsis coloradensis TaxID=76021 RepID=UPI001ABF6AB4|nr:hypothetical protein [Amycolatopsis coloradensis]